MLSTLLCLLPVSELRGGLPFALSQGLPPVIAFLFCISVNTLVSPLVFLFLSTLHRVLIPLKLYSRIFERLVERARQKLRGKIEKYGYWGIAIFVGIPLPVTGAYTGTLGAWILGMHPKKSVLFITMGVILSGMIVSIVYYLVTRLGVEALKIFITE